MRLASCFGYAANQIRRDRPLTHEELMHHVPGIFGEEKHTSRSQNYTYIPTITVLESLTSRTVPGDGDIHAVRMAVTSPVTDFSL